MVEGVNNSSNNNYPTKIKLKAKNQETKTIDLTKLEGLKRTEQNKSWFDQIDSDHNGTIDSNEALVAKNNLTTISNGNGKLTQKEAKKFGVDFNALATLAEQQSKLEQNQEYSEKNGDVTTTVTKDGTTYNYANGDVKTVKSDGTTVTQFHEGITQTTYPDGSSEVTTENGGVEKYQNGVKVSYTDSEGNTTTFTPDGNKSITKNSDGQTTKTIELRDKQEVRTEYEYTDNGTIAREYNGLGDDAQLASITVSTKENGHTKDVKYSSEDAMKNNLPSEEITDAQNPTLKKTTTYTYDDKGNVKTETKNSAGDIETKYTDKDGKEIPSNQFDAPAEHTVQKGESITTIVKNALKEQGYTDEDLKNNPDILQNAKAEFLEANKDTVKTYNGSKAEWKGNKYFLTGEKVTIPKFTKDGGEPQAVDATVKQPTEEAKKLRAELQAQLGENYDVGYDQEGKIEVRDKKGNVLANATQKANDKLAAANNSDVPDAETSAEADQVISQYDTVEKDNQLNKEEFRNYIIETLRIEVTDANREQIEKIIDDGFTSIDSIETDGKITKEELLSKVSEQTMETLQSKIDELEQNQI
jgi:hypothetical protein